MVENLIEESIGNLNLSNLPQIKSLTITDKIFQFILQKWFSDKKDRIVKWLTSIKEFNYKFGTKEWADDNFNTHYACKHGCWYCYAWCEAYQRQREYCSDWGKKMTLRDYWNKGWQTRPDGYTIMYPTTHDILPEIVDESFQAIQNMLDANINVLVVTKPHFEVIKEIVRTFTKYKSGNPKIILRFSIGTNNDELLSFWEPNTPKFGERFRVLKYAYNKEFHTSVSMEPFFPTSNDNKTPTIENFIELVKNLLKFVKGTLWIGKMNHIPVNVQRGKALSFREQNKINYLRKFYKLENIITLVSELYRENQVKWKESIKRVIIKEILKEV
jgi:DNA repair photolyase